LEETNPIKVWCHENKMTSFSLLRLLILVFSLESCHKFCIAIVLHILSFGRMLLIYLFIYLFIFNFIFILCVFVLLLVKVVLFSLTRNTSIVANFCFACTIPTCCLVIASFTPTLIACWLLASFVLAPPIYCMLPPPPMPTFTHLSTSTITTYLPTLLFAYFELQARPPTWYFPLTYLHKRCNIKRMCINLKF